MTMNSPPFPWTQTSSSDHVGSMSLICLMISTLSGNNSSPRRSVFQWLASQSMRSITRSAGSPPLRFAITLYDIGLGSHLSSHALMLLPLPIDHIVPSLTMCWAAQRLRHAKLGLWPTLAFKKEDERKYLALRSLAVRESGDLISLQPCLANRAKLKLCKSRKPIQPLCFDLLILSQLIQWVFLFSVSFPHQILHKSYSISSQKPLGIRKQDMA